METNEPNLYTVDELIDYQKNTCRKPTEQNPLMNPNVLEYNDGDPPVACNEDDDNIKDNINVSFNHGLFRDLDDLYERKISQRQFYTIPNTAVPNNQTEFAKWLYKLPDSAVCKVTGNNCLRYRNLVRER